MLINYLSSSLARNKHILLVSIQPDALLPILKGYSGIIFGLPIHYGVQDCAGLAGDTIRKVAKDDPAVVGGGSDFPLIHNSVHELGDGKVHGPFNSMLGLVLHNFQRTTVALLRQRCILLL